MDALNRCRLANRRRAGTSMVEMAFVLPVLLILMFGLADFSLVFHDYLAAMNAARAGVRQATLARLQCTHATVEQDARDTVKKMLENNAVKNFTTTFVYNPVADLCKPGHVELRIHVKSHHRLLAGFFNDPVSFPGIEFTAMASAMHENGF
jgi:Flp pilus assembly protein TadG